MITVGLTVGQYHDSSVPYRAALEAAGVRVRLLSSVEVTSGHVHEAAARMADLDGIVLAGGGDIDPQLLEQEDAFHPNVYGVDRNRDEWERAVFDEAWRLDMPIFAICRGMQLMNWALGGTLCADLDDLHAPRGLPKGHRQTDHGYSRFEPTHGIDIVPASLLHDIVGDTRLHVNSIHHQSLAEPARNLVVTARADDGVIEAVEDRQRAFVLGVQFHPEEMWRSHRSFLAMFERFASAARAFGRPV